MNSNISIINKPSIEMVNGFFSNGVCCGLKKNNDLDLGLVYSEVKAKTVAVYTINKFKGAPLMVAQKHLKDNLSQALIVNSKIANTCTGQQGIEDSLKICEEVAKTFNIDSNDVIPMSTGVIGDLLPIEKILKGIHKLKPIINTKNSNNFSKAIMTTDTYSKIFGVTVKEQGVEYKIVGTAKGSGMIQPNMATLLAFIFTDVNINKRLLNDSFKECINKSFNSITVDGDTSTNDTAIIFANGQAKNKEIEKFNSNEYKTFCEALLMVMTSLAKEIVKNGEGATKFIEIEVNNARTEKEAKQVCFTVANSKLVKTAFFGEDANWGRIICAIGYSGVNFDQNKVKLTIGNITVFNNGKKENFIENNLKKILHNKEIKLSIDLNTGSRSSKVWTSDLSYDYVKINASYKT